MLAKSAVFLALLCAPFGGACADAALLQLKASAPLAKDADALPRLLAGAPPRVIARINATLEGYDARSRREMRFCSRTTGSFEQSVSTTMQGPRFLSLVVTTASYCAGAAHPLSSLLSIVFDLSTGRQVNWEKLLPGVAHSEKFKFDPAVSSPAIMVLFKKAIKENHAEPGCEDATDGIAFELALNAEKGALVVDETGMRSRDKACGNSLDLSVAQLQALGARRELTDALSSAQALSARKLHDNQSH